MAVNYLIELTNYYFVFIVSSTSYTLEGFPQIFGGVVLPGDRGRCVETAPIPSTDSLDRSSARCQPTCLIYSIIVERRLIVTFSSAHEKRNI